MALSSIQLQLVPSFGMLVRMIPSMYSRSFCGTIYWKIALQCSEHVVLLVAIDGWSDLIFRSCHLGKNRIVLDSKSRWKICACINYWSMIWTRKCYISEKCLADDDGSCVASCYTLQFGDHFFWHRPAASAYLLASSCQRGIYLQLVATTAKERNTL